MAQSDFMSRPERILVVEDDEFSQELIQLYLRKAGFNELTIAANGHDALNIAKQQTFDLVLLDLNLPRISGSEVLRRLKKEGMLTDTPVIISSSIGNMDDIVQCIDLGAEDFLLKPFNVRLLEGRVSAILEKKRLREESRVAKANRSREDHAARLLQGTISSISLPSARDEHGLAAAVTLSSPLASNDFYNMFMLPDGVAFFMIGTVTEINVAAALTMSRVHAMVRRSVDRLLAEGGHVEAHAVLAWVNRELYQSDPGSHQGAQTALLVGTVALSDNHLQLASAGHPDPLLLSTRRGVVSLSCDRGRPLGVHPDAVYTSKNISLEQDDAVFLHTKGLLDVTDASGMLFGESRMKAKLEDCDPLQPNGIVTGLEAEIRRFMGQTQQREDITILALRCGSI